MQTMDPRGLPCSRETPVILAQPPILFKSISVPLENATEPNAQPVSRAIPPFVSDSANFPSLPRSHDSPPGSKPATVSPNESNPWNKPCPVFNNPQKKFMLRYIPPTHRGNDLVGVCPAEAITGEMQILDNTVVGFFLGKKPGFFYVRDSLLKQWRLSGSVEILQLLNGGIAFRFSSLVDRDMVLEAGVFHVAGQPIFLQQWERNLHTGNVLGLRKVPLWVTLPGLPLHLWGEDSLSAICSVLGRPLFTDRITAMKSRWVFARVCVEFSGKDPLLDSVIVEDDEGNIFHQPVKYEWCPPQCTTCGVFGHSLNSCMQNPSSAEENGQNEPHHVQAAPQQEYETFKERTSILGAVQDPNRNSVKKGRPLLRDFGPRRLGNRKAARVRLRRSPCSGKEEDLLDDPNREQTREQTILAPSDAKQNLGRMSSIPLSSEQTSDFDQTNVVGGLPKIPVSKSTLPAPNSLISPNRFDALVDPMAQISADDNSLSPTHPAEHISSTSHPLVPSAVVDYSEPNSESLIVSGPNANLPSTSGPRNQILKTAIPFKATGSPPSTPAPNLDIRASNPSSIGHTPYLSRRMSTNPSVSPSDYENPNPMVLESRPQTFPLPLRSIPPSKQTKQKKFRSITPETLESMMAPPVVIQPHDSDGRDDEGKEAADGEADESARRKKENHSREKHGDDQALAPRKIESWEDLENSLRNPQRFFHCDNHPPYQLFL